MAKQELSRQLANITHSFAKSIFILFRMYGPLLKSLILMLLAYLAFKIGRRSVVDPLEEDVKRIRSILENRAKYSIQLPEKIARISRVKKVIIAVLLLLIVGSVMVRYKVSILKKVIKFSSIFKLGILTCIVLFLIWTYEVILNMELQKGRALNLKINEQMLTLQKLIGPRGGALLKETFCREKLASKKKRPANTCWKDDCKEERNYLKIKYEIKEKLVHNALTFEWCSTCKYKKPFNEYLQFEGFAYEPDPSLSAEQEVSRRYRYMLDEVGRIVSWVRNVDPCNCSKIYWISQLRQIKQYKEEEKKNEQAHQIYSNRKMIRKF